MAWLHRTHGVEVINFADENPTASRAVWRALLEALIAENVPLTLVGSTHADDIVRDAGRILAHTTDSRQRGHKFIVGASE